jgi:hypothetical protein
MHDAIAQSAPSDFISDGSDHLWLPGLALSLSLFRARSVFVAVRSSRLSQNRGSAIAADSFAKGNLVREGESFVSKRESVVLASLKRKMRSKQNLRVGFRV